MNAVRWAYVAFVFSVSACTHEDPIVVSGAWLRPPAPGLQVAAGYFDIVNRGDASIDLVGASSDLAGAVEIHSQTHDGGVMQMRRLDKLTLAPGQTTTLAPGGTHLMLLRFTGVTSHQIPITLTFSDATQRVVWFEVRTLSGAQTP
jgi:periplasmic copper chaperone A